MTNFNQKTVAVSLLLFIAVITPTLTFGAVYGKVTGNLVGTVETILATSWVGCFYALFSGMPLAIIGSTGPVLAFTKAVVSMSQSMGVNYMTFNAWISVWLFIYCVLAAFFDLTRVVRLATRFTDEVSCGERTTMSQCLIVLLALATGLRLITASPFSSPAYLDRLSLF